MMRATYTSKSYDPARSYKRYVRCDLDGSYHFCEINDDRSDIRQGTVDPVDLPETVRDAADALQGYFPSFVDWPLPVESAAKSSAA